PGARALSAESDAAAQGAHDHERAARDEVGDLDPAVLAVAQVTQGVSTDVEALPEEHLDEARDDVQRPGGEAKRERRPRRRPGCGGRHSAQSSTASATSWSRAVPQPWWNPMSSCCCRWAGSVCMAIAV